MLKSIPPVQLWGGAAIFSWSASKLTFFLLVGSCWPMPAIFLNGLTFRGPRGFAKGDQQPNLHPTNLHFYGILQYIALFDQFFLCFSCLALPYHAQPRSRSQVEGARPTENKYNKMVHELAKARQFCRFTAARGSRMFNWMSAQQGFLDYVKPSSKTAEPDEPVDPVLPCRIFRPLTSSEIQHQFVLFKANKGGIVTFHVGLVYGVYRGKVTRQAGVSRKLKVSKAMSINAPVEAVSRALVLEAEKVDKKGCFVTSLLAPAHLLIPYLEIACELPCSEVGEKSGKLFFSLRPETMEILGKVEKGEIDPFSFGEDDGKQASQPAEAQTESSLDGFSIGDFTKNAAGLKKIQQFLTQLPRAYKAAEINLLDALLVSSCFILFYDVLCCV